MTDNNYPDTRYMGDESEIDLMELVAKVWKQRRKVILWCAVGAVVGLVVGFSTPATFSAKVLLAPEQQQRTNSSVSSIASMMGFSLNNSVDAISVEMFPDVVSSTPFIVDLLDTPVTFERNDSTMTTTLWEYMDEHQKSSWISHVISAPFKALGWFMGLFSEKEEDVPVEIAELDPANLPKNVRKVVDKLSKDIVVTVDKKSGKTEMSLLMQDPQVVAVVLQTVVDNLKSYMSDYRTSKARQDVTNLSAICQQRKDDYYAAQRAYAEYTDANKNVVRQSIQIERDRLQQEMNLAYQVYSQVATQLEGARIQEQQAKPVFAIIKPVTVPLRKAAPSKAKLLVVFTFLAGCCAAAWILFGEDYWKKFKENL